MTSHPFISYHYTDIVGFENALTSQNIRNIEIFSQNGLKPEKMGQK